MSDKIWDTAKRVVVDNKMSGDWFTIMDVYHYMGGTSKHMYAILSDTVTYRVLAVLNATDILVFDTRKQELSIENRQVLNITKKQFIDSIKTNMVTLAVSRDISDAIDKRYAKFLDNDVSEITFNC